MKLGLVMEGGAMRGMFTVGVTDVMMENGIRPDGAIGVSAGAVFGCNYKSRQIGRVIRYNTRFCRDPRYCSFRSLMKTGDLYGAEFCYKTMPDELDIFDRETYRNDPMEFYVTCSDIVTGKPVYHRCDTGDSDDLEWMRASASLPLVSRIVEIGGYKLLDGGICDSVPLKAFEEMGYDRNIVILTQPKGYIKHKNKMLPLIKASMRKYPEFIRAASVRHDMYNATTAYIEQREKEGNTLVIRPEEGLDIGSVERNADKLRHVYSLGRAAAEKRLPELLEFVKR